MMSNWFGTAFPWEYRWRVPILFLSQPAFAGLCYWVGDRSTPWYAPTFTLQAATAAVLLATAGILLRIWAASFMTAAVMASKHPDTEQLVSGGPYGNSRNPLYVGSLLIFAGYGVFFGPVAAMLFALFHWVRYERVIRYEESQLRGRWGAAFDEFCRQVPRWLPTWNSAIAVQGPYFSWEAVLGNSLFIGLGIGYAASLITGTLAALVPFEIGGIAVAILYYVLLNRVRTADVASGAKLPADRRELSIPLPTGADRPDQQDQQRVA